MASVAQYADFGTGIAHAHVSKFGPGSTEIIEKSDETTVVFDLSAVKVPENSIFETMMLDAGRPVTMSYVTVIGGAEVMACSAMVKLEFKFIPAAA